MTKEASLISLENEYKRLVEIEHRLISQIRDETEKTKLTQLKFNSTEHMKELSLNEKSSIIHQISLAKTALEDDKALADKTELENSVLQKSLAELKNNVHEVGSKLHAVKISSDKEKNNLRHAQVELLKLQKLVDHETDCAVLLNQTHQSLIHQCQLSEKDLKKSNERVSISRKKELALESKNELLLKEFQELKRSKDNLQDLQLKWSELDRVIRPIELHPWRYLKYVNPDEYERIQISLEMKSEMNKTINRISSSSSSLRKFYPVLERSRTAPTPTTYIVFATFTV